MVRFGEGTKGTPGGAVKLSGVTHRPTLHARRGTLVEGNLNYHAQSRFGADLQNVLISGLTRNSSVLFSTKFREDTRKTELLGHSVYRMLRRLEKFRKHHPQETGVPQPYDMSVENKITAVVEQHWERKGEPPSETTLGYRFHGAKHPKILC